MLHADASAGTESRANGCSAFIVMCGTLAGDCLRPGSAAIMALTHGQAQNCISCLLDLERSPACSFPKVASKFHHDICASQGTCQDVHVNACAERDPVE